jgi:TetR/AcrR family transcriptional repressor of mexJK operon
MNSTVQFTWLYAGNVTQGSESAVRPAARRPPTGERAEASRRAITAAAREAFLRDGYEAGMDAIADRARVSKVTIYNHFGSKEALFTAVVGEALDAALSSTLTEAQTRLDAAKDLREQDLREKDLREQDLREALTWMARAWVRGVTEPAVLALRNLVTSESRRFPELIGAWHARGPGRFFTLLSGLLGRLIAAGELSIADVDLAVVQLFALTLYPHLVYSSEGAAVPPELSEQLIVKGVDMFLSYYRL